MSGMRFPYAVAATVTVAMVVGGLAAMKMRNRRPVQQIAQVAPTASPSPRDTPVVVSATKSTSGTDKLMGEIRWLPRGVSLQATSASLQGRALAPANKKVVSSRKITSKDQQGQLLHPRWSPDGLSLMVSRPGYDGIYMLDPATGNLTRIADGNAYNARWTKDGKIAVTNGETTDYYNPDGSKAESAEPLPAQSVVAENDNIYIRDANGALVPITSSNDKFFQPITSPDGKWVVYESLASGLFLAPTDGSAPPQSVGRGTNPSWMPDSSGLVFDRTQDDGHHLTEGDIIYMSTDLSSSSNLTEGDGVITQYPTIAPNGRDIVYEVDGEVIIGTLR